jgi:hypothetical protein
MFDSELGIHLFLNGLSGVIWVSILFESSLDVQLTTSAFRRMVCSLVNQVSAVFQILTFQLTSLRFEGYSLSLS